METLDLLRLSNRKCSLLLTNNFKGSNASSVGSEKSAMNYLIKAKIEESQLLRGKHKDFEPLYSPNERNHQSATSNGERSYEAPVWFTKRTDRSWVTRKLDESTLDSLVKQHGRNFREKLSFDEINKLLLKLGYNPYRTEFVVNRPRRWMLHLDNSEEERKSKFNCCGTQLN